MFYQVKQIYSCISLTLMYTYFFKIYIGPLNHVVWALDDEGKTYFRSGITRHLPIGTHWHLVEGIQAIHLSIRYREKMIYI